MLRFKPHVLARTLAAYQPQSFVSYGIDATGWHLLQAVSDFLGPAAGERVMVWLRAGQRILHRPTVTYAFKHGSAFVARPFTLDRLVLNEVLVSNIYRRCFDVQEGDTVVDLGAHIGVFTVLAASRGRGVRVYSYEPLSDNLELLGRNVALNGVNDQVTICPVAVGGTRGRQTFGVSAGGMGRLASSVQGLKYREVDTITLQDVFATHGLVRINFLKVDIEAAEYALFAALPEAYLRRIDRITMECHTSADPERFPLLIGQLEEAGFTLSIVPGDNASLRCVFAWRPASSPVEADVPASRAAESIPLIGAPLGHG